MSLPDGTYTAVLDRVETDAEGRELAVFEVRGNDERAQLVREMAILPEAGRHVDAVYEVVVADGEAAFEYNPEESEGAQEQAQDRFDRLSTRPPDEG
ncbi:DUF3006 domain-containing protein [Halosegnis sp.]|uniref:DUF3006 domain-containing protein n=1 Tax=Halosegnis sp. TaxID=2864959 RepID=UPI0035D44332